MNSGPLDDRRRFGLVIVFAGGDKTIVRFDTQQKVIDLAKLLGGKMKDEKQQDSVFEISSKETILNDNECGVIEATPLTVRIRDIVRLMAVNL